EDLVTNLVWRPLAGFVQIAVSPPVLGSSVVSIDGRLLGEESFYALQVGAHNLVLSYADYYPYQRLIEVTDAITNYLQITLKPRPATLTIEAKPDLEYALLDDSGQKVAVRNNTAELPPGTTKLTLRA